MKKVISFISGNSQAGAKTRRVFLTGCISLVLFFSSCDEDFVVPPAVTISEDYVDLRPQQSAIRNQGGRSTCIVFAAIGAAEASYRRMGYGELDLSEEFINYARKSFYIHPIWEETVARGEDGFETQLGYTGGGNGAAVLAELSRGYRVPLEGIMRYRNSDWYYPDNFAALRRIIEMQAAGETVKQRDYDDFNLDSLILNNTNLRAEEYYSVSNYRDIANATDTDEIEDVLKRRIEVVWDFYGADPSGAGIDDNHVWQYCPSCTTFIPHSMLIVGFDKRDSDPAKHYFIVKNSWGRADGDMEGYTKISYEYVRHYGTSAGYVTVANPPRTWEELAFIGRWKFNFDGFKGDLDIYHVPGMADYSFEFWKKAGVIDEIYDDYRIGTFYDSDGKAFKVNGKIKGNRIEFYFDGSKPKLRWDELRGRKFVYYLDGSNFMAGHHTDEDGSVYGGYARKAGYISEGALTPRPFQDVSYMDSRWQLYSEGVLGQILFTKNLTDKAEDFFLLEGTYTSAFDGTTSVAQIKIPRSEANRAYIQVANLGNGKGAGSFIGKHLSWEDGLISGNTPETGKTLPFSMTRLKK